MLFPVKHGVLTSLSFIPKGHPLIHAPVGQADFVR